jgi:hypothetical protein
VNRAPATEWVSVAVAASLMGLCKRQALRRLRRLDGELGGRLLRSIGAKRMPRGLQASKLLVNTSALREALEPSATDLQRDFERLRLEQTLTAQRLEALCRRLRPLLRRDSSGTGRFGARPPAR